MNAESWAVLMAWLTIYQWLAISAVFVYDSWRVHFRTARLLRTARAIGNGMVIISEVRNKISWWYIIGSCLALVLGALAVISNAAMDPPAPDTRIVGAVIREGVVVMLFAFWRTKRLNVVLFRLMDSRRKDAEGDAKQMDRIEKKIDDAATQQDVDRGEEQVDRSEGRTHRHLD